MGREANSYHSDRRDSLIFRNFCPEIFLTTRVHNPRDDMRLWWETVGIRRLEATCPRRLNGLVS